jgi:hypothetical protein
MPLQMEDHEKNCVVADEVYRELVMAGRLTWGRLECAIANRGRGADQRR